MEFEKFKKFIDAARSIDGDNSSLYKLGFDISSSNILDNIWSIELVLFSEIYGNDGYDLLLWYLYEMPEDNEPHMWDKDKNVIDVSTDEKLWELLEKDYKKQKEEE